MFRTIALVLVFTSMAVCQIVSPGARPVSAGYTVFAIEQTGFAWAWGYNYYGQTGTGSNAPTYVTQPQPCIASAPVSAISCGDNHSLYLFTDGTVRAAGYNGDGQLGNGSYTNSSSPVQVVNLNSVVAISAGGGFSVALKSDGTVWTWGSGGLGQLGHGISSGSPTPVQVANGLLNNIVAIDAGGNHCLALRSDGTIWAWGYNCCGQLGNATTTNTNSPIPVAFGLLTNVVAVSAGGNHSVALRTDGSVWCWGNGANGETGNGTWNSYTSPVPSNAIADVVEIAAGNYHTVARKSDQTLLAWGSNNDGCLGNGGSLNLNSPVPVANLTSVTAIAAGGSTNVARKSDGTIWTWGNGSNGQMGNGGTTNTNSTPISPSTLYLGGAYLGQDGQSTVGVNWGPAIDVLSINGSTGIVASNGFRTHRIDVAATAPITISVSQPSTNILPAAFAIYGFVGVPALGDAITLPYNIGTMCFTPYTLNPSYPGAFLLANSYGFDPAALVPATAAPWSFTLPTGIPFPFQLSFQGVVAETPATVRTTNGVILNVQ